MEVLTAQFVWDQLITDIKSVNKQTNMYINKQQLRLDPNQNSIRRFITMKTT